MTEIASIVSTLATVTTTLESAAKQLLEVQNTTLPQGAVDLKELADHTLKHTSLAREVAGRLDMNVLAQEFDTSDIAGAIDLSDLANEFSARDIADEIDLNDLRDKVLDSLSSDIDTDEIARKAAEEIDAAAVAQELDTSAIAEEVAENLDMDEMAEAVAESLEVEQLEDIGRSVCDRMKNCPDTMRAVLTVLAKDTDFVAAVAREMAAAMLRGSESQEPHGARDTFVPATDGPVGEKFNTMAE